MVYCWVMMMAFYHFDVDLNNKQAIVDTPLHQPIPANFNTDIGIQNWCLKRSTFFSHLLLLLHLSDPPLQVEKQVQCQTRILACSWTGPLATVACPVTASQWTAGEDREMPHELSEPGEMCHNVQIIQKTPHTVSVVTYR